MDSSSSSSQDWLGFSLSHHHGQPASDHSQLCLFEAFNTTQEQDNVHLSLFNGGRKLEDFLGGGARALPEGQFSGEATHESHEPTGMYDSDLKTIAASFLRGYSSTIDQTTTTTTTTAIATNSDKAVAVVPVETSSKKSVDNFGQRTSIYRGVTRHRWTGRYEAHLWDNSCRREGQSRKGRQVYLGGYDKEEKAARAYDLAALKYWGPTTTTNFPVSGYEKEIEEMKNMSRQEFVASLRRKSSGFSRGASIYRGVTRHHQHGRWQARIGRVAGNKDLYLGTFSTEEEAAEAYDIAAIKFRGLNAVTNFDMSRYDVKSIANSNLPIGGINNGKTKASSAPESTENKIPAERSSSRSADELDNLSSVTSPSSTTLNFAIPIKQDPSDCNWINGINVGPGLQSLSSSSSMDYYQANNINRFWNTGVVVQQQSSSTSIPFAAPITVSGNSYESSSYGNWVSASPHSYQAAKPNISVFQTPIFGME